MREYQQAIQYHLNNLLIFVLNKVIQAQEKYSVIVNPPMIFMNVKT